MCLITRELPIVLENDIICYKVVVKRFLFGEGEERYYSPFMGTRLYEVNEGQRLEPTSIPDYDGRGLVYLHDKGFHAFRELGDARWLVDSEFLSEGHIARCVIPAGTKAAFDSPFPDCTGEVVAEKLIIKEIL